MGKCAICGKKTPTPTWGLTICSRCAKKGLGYKDIKRKKNIMGKRKRSKAPALYPRKRKRSKKRKAPALYPRQRRKGKRREIYIPSFTRNGKKIKGFWRKK